ncbi:hypothetical protein GNQ08_20515 [Paenibacillus macerans]|uniref:Transmembrane Fragile-X-F family protein n=1 Tax=Paenibacillus macerans TaxID=44252 RepID=A0A6N8EYL1_PAEMA|nr:hypothetical protein [Paenibacillus macerans]MUG24755.1 hypothetical protein [Paenibacillus macerans]
MSKQKETASGGGISVIGLLGIAFVILKLCGVINWSWWWVTAPFWGGIAIVILIVLIYLISVAVVKMFESIARKG